MTELLAPLVLAAAVFYGVLGAAAARFLMTHLRWRRRHARRTVLCEIVDISVLRDARDRRRIGGAA